MKIAIPSYKRSSTIFSNTIMALLDAGVNLSDVTVFISDKNEHDLYQKQVGTWVNVVNSLPTLSANRSFILDYYDAGEHIVMVDDDIKQFQQLSPDGTKLEQADFYSFTQKGFKHCVDQNLTLWGIYAASNPFFMKHRVTKGLFYTIGSCYGIINTKADYHKVASDEKEDYARSLQTFQAEHGLVRLENITVESHYYTQAGGLQETRTKQRVKNATLALSEQYSDFCKPYIRKTTGYYELRLNNAKYKTTVLEKLL